MKKSRGIKIVIAIVTVILIASGAGFIFLKSKLAKINRIKPEDDTCISRDQESLCLWSLLMVLAYDLSL